MSKSKQEKQSETYIFRPWTTIKGVKYYAKDYGKKAFRIPVIHKTA